jgi:hypothetical protein
MSSTELQSQVWIPCPDCAPFHIRCPTDALDLAVGWPVLPVFGFLMALLGADRRVDALVLNPSPDVLFAPEEVPRPGLPRPVHAVALFSADPESEDTAPGFSYSVFTALQRRYRAAGIQLVDWVQIDFDQDLFRSMQSAARDIRGVATDYLRAGTCV